jgi:hypothetical protein
VPLTPRHFLWTLFLSFFTRAPTWNGLGFCPQKKKILPPGRPIQKFSRYPPCSGQASGQKVLWPQQLNTMRLPSP